jgi:F-type H+-transporting ATPase subunit b
MPQLDVASYLPQIVWLAVCFAALYLLMAKLALPRIAAVLEERTRRREDDLARAEELEARAEAAAQAYEQVLAEARGSAHDRLSASAEAAKARAEAAIDELDQKLAGEIASAEAAINEAKQVALGEATAIAAEAARLAAAKLAGIEVDEAAASAAADAARKARP